MKKILAIAALALVGFSSSALAQPFTPAAPPYEVSASGSVANALLVYELKAMNLGTINNNGIGMVKTIAGNDETNSAHFGIAGDAGDNVTISGISASLAWVPAPGQVATGQTTTLTGSGFDIYKWTGTTVDLVGNNVTSATIGLDGAPGTLGSYVPVLLSVPASYGWSGVLVGCDFNVAADQQQGAYTGTVTIVAAY